MIKYKNTLLGKVSNMLKGRRMHFLQYYVALHKIFLN